MNAIIRITMSAPSIGISLKDIYIKLCVSIVINDLQTVYFLRTTHKAHKVG